MKVAAYCRVSTDRDDQANSLENQELYFREFISGNPDWHLVKIYSDEGITGTSVKKRAGFNEMIRSALHGNIDLILTKEVSRFARNTVDTLQYTRELRRHNVGVFFINDNINTLDNDGEFRLSIMASAAQEESRKISSRVKWGMQRQMERGYVFTSPLIGYDYAHGVLTVNPKEAEIVRRIFHMYVYDGMGSVLIARKMAEENIPLCKQAKCWSPTLIMRIIKNEKYAGDLLMKKTVTLDYLTHQSVKNNNIEDKVFFKDHHEPIVSREVWEKAQEICTARGKNAVSHTPASARANRYWCSGKISCGVCGGAFAVKTKKAQYGIIHIWRCRHTTHYDNHTGGCGNKTYIDERILRACVQHVLSGRFTDSEKILNLLKTAMESLNTQDDEVCTGEEDRKKVQQKRQKLLDLLLDGTITRQDYQNTADRLDKELHAIQRSMDAHRETAARRDAVSGQTAAVLEKAEEYLRQNEPTPYLYAGMVEKITVYPDHHVDVFLKGAEQPFSVAYERTGRGEQYLVSCRDFQDAV